MFCLPNGERVSHVTNEMRLNARKSYLKGKERVRLKEEAKAKEQAQADYYAYLCRNGIYI